MITKPNRWRPGFLETHVEKFVLAACAGFAATVAWQYALHTPNLVQMDGKWMSGDEVNAELAAAADAIERRMTAPAEVRTAPVPAYARRLAKLHEAGALGRELAAAGSLVRESAAADAGSAANASPIRDRLTIATAFGPEFDAGDFDVDAERGVVEIVTPISPTDAAAIAGRSMVRPRRQYANAAGGVRAGEVEPNATEKDPLPVPRELAWVSVSARLDAAAQKRAFANGHYSRIRSRVEVVAIEAQRSESLADGQWSAWQDVAGDVANLRFPVPDPAFDDATGRLVNRAAINQTRAMLHAAQGAIMRPEFFEVVAGDPWRLRAAGDAERLNLTGESGAAAPAGAQTIWFHDTTATGGKTYRYRLRVLLWNTYAGRRAALRDPRQAAVATLTGAWSAATPPVEVPRSTRFFVLGGGPEQARPGDSGAATLAAGRETANIEVWKWSDGLWLRRVFNVSAGDSLGERVRVKVGPPPAPKARLPRPDRPKGRNVRPAPEPTSDIPTRPVGPQDTAHRSDDPAHGDPPPGDAPPQPGGTSRPAAEYREVDFSTGVTILDVRREWVERRLATGARGEFSYQPAEATLVTYFDALDGQVRRASDVEDRGDAVRKALATAP